MSDSCDSSADLDLKLDLTWVDILRTWIWTWWILMDLAVLLLWWLTVSYWPDS